MEKISLMGYIVVGHHIRGYSIHIIWERIYIQ